MDVISHYVISRHCRYASGGCYEYMRITRLRAVAMSHCRYYAASYCYDTPGGHYYGYYVDIEILAMAAALAIAATRYRHTIKVTYYALLQDIVTCREMIRQERVDDDDTLITLILILVGCWR